ncbi:MAG: Holliday junction branch migration protein RuvA [Lachnospiraceae bacterium]|nr:Holliday junction branch migration protein RuvA [Lachnospiraceae bacterium]
MYAYIEGELAMVENDRIVIDAGGIGYEIVLGTRDLAGLSTIGSHHRIYTYFQVSENGIGLYGFLSYEDKKFFEKLISVNGVGPKAGIAILGTMSVNDLQFAILGEDEKTICKAPGVGPKLAKRIILDLKDKIDLADAYESRHSSNESDQISTIKNEVILAMGSLGYSSSDALKVLSAIDITEDMRTEDLLREALRKMNI